MDVKNRFFQAEYPSRIREYLTQRASIREVDLNGDPGAQVRPAAVSENTFYRFDSDALCAMFHALEDLALEAAEGHLTGCVQDFEGFEADTERYAQLAATLDDVQMILSGNSFPRVRHLKVTYDKRGLTGPYWILLYSGARDHAMFAARDLAPAASFENKEFLGCCSFNAQVIQRCQEDLNDLIAGREQRLNEFQRMEAIDRAAKQIKAEFARQNATLETAMQELIVARSPKGPKQISRELEQGVIRLEEWKSRLPQILQ